MASTTLPATHLIVGELDRSGTGGPPCPPAPPEARPCHPILCNDALEVVRQLQHAQLQHSHRALAERTAAKVPHGQLPQSGDGAELQTLAASRMQPLAPRRAKPRSRIRCTAPVRPVPPSETFRLSSAGRPAARLRPPVVPRPLLLISSWRSSGSAAARRAAAASSRKPLPLYQGSVPRCGAVKPATSAWPRLQPTARASGRTRERRQHLAGKRIRRRDALRKRQSCQLEQRGQPGEPRAPPVRQGCRRVVQQATAKLREYKQV